MSKTKTVYTSSLNGYLGPFTKMIFGDLRGMELAVDPYGLFDKDQTRLRVTERIWIETPVGAYFSYLKGLKNTLYQETGADGPAHAPGCHPPS